MARTIGIPGNPVFESVSGLTNTTIGEGNSMGDRLATEDQVLQCWNSIQDLRERSDACCRDLLIWEARVQVVQMYKNTLASQANGAYPNSGGTVVSSFDENISTGYMRRSKKYTITFPIKWDMNLYVGRDVFAKSVTDCACGLGGAAKDYTTISYRIVEDDFLAVGKCAVTASNNSGFWIVPGSEKTVNGCRINPNNVWTTFSCDISDDGLVSITDNRRSQGFTVIRYYTQWILRQCTNGSTFTDP